MRKSKLTLRYPVFAEFERMHQALVDAGGKLLEDEKRCFLSLFRAVEVALGYETDTHPWQREHCTFLVNFLHQHFIRQKMTTEAIRLLHSNIIPPQTKGVFIYDEAQKYEEIARGRYRRIDTYLKDADGVEVNFLLHTQIADALEEAVATFHNSPKKVADIARFFLAYNAIHPFMDGNGKVERLLPCLWHTATTPHF